MFLNNQMKFRKSLDVPDPFKKHLTDAGWDLSSPIDFAIAPGKMSDRINLGVGFEVPNRHCGYVVERSSQGKKGVHAIGPVVDHGYTGDVHVTLVNNGNEEYVVKKGDRICQILFITLYTLDNTMVEVNEFEDTERGNDGHGSSGA